MINKKLLTLAFATAIFIIACNDSGNPDKAATPAPDSTATDSSATADAGPLADSLPESVVKYLDTVPQVKVNINEVMLPNGEKYGPYRIKLNQKKDKQENKNLVFRDDGPAEQLAQLIANFATTAASIANDANHQKPAGAADEPKQDGLAYNYGSRDYNARKKMFNIPCVMKVFGLDCSGYLYHIFIDNGCSDMDLVAAEQAKPANLNKAIAGVVSGVKAADKGKLTSTSIQSGDLVYWDKLDGQAASHIGIALKSGNTVYIYQSNGLKQGCAENLLTGRGPRNFTLSDSYWFGANANWKVLRYEVQ